MEKSDFGNLIHQAKSSPKKKVTQKVTPVKEKNTTEVQFSFYIEASLLKKLKLKALTNDTSIKQIINESIAKYID